MRLIIILILFSALGCKSSKTNSNPVINQTEKNSSKSLDLIPANVIYYLKNNLSGWNIPDTSDYSKAWWSFYERNQIPYFVTTDFNDDNVSDYAFILKNKNSIKLVILVGSGETFTHWIADDFKETYKDNVKDIQYGLNIEPPARIDCVVDNKECSLALRSNGFVLMELEKKLKIYYWDQGAIKTFRVI
jgi:hypothetical protein